MKSPTIYADHIMCPDCKHKLVDLEYALTVTGKCSHCRETVNKYSKAARKTHNIKIADYLAIMPISKEDLLFLPTGTPVWIETYTGTEAVVTCADVITGIAGGNFLFLSELALPANEYNVAWRLWPTFKTFRPSELDAANYQWGPRPKTLRDKMIG